MPGSCWLAGLEIGEAVLVDCDDLAGGWFNFWFPFASSDVVLVYSTSGFLFALGSKFCLLALLLPATLMASALA